MFGMGMPEILLILAIALVILGPKKLPDLAKSLGRAMGEFKRATSDLKESIETETGMDEVRQSMDEVKDDIEAQVDLAGTVPDPEPVSESPSPDDQLDDDSYDGLDDDSADDSKDSMDRVKTAFDEMNADSGDPQSDTPPDDDTDTQETPKS